MVKVLFVCLGNICRSPLAEGVFRELVREAGLGARIAVDSAGTGRWHVGEPPDPRACAAAKGRGIDIGGLRARRVSAGDYTAFDRLVAMDLANHRSLVARSPSGAESRVGLLLDYAPESGVREVPDPYYGGDEGFERVLDLIEAGARGLLAEIRRDLD